MFSCTLKYNMVWHDKIGGNKKEKEQKDNSPDVNIYLFGESHIGTRSGRELSKSIENNKPDVFYLELDEDRFEKKKNIIRAKNKGKISQIIYALKLYFSVSKYLPIKILLFPVFLLIILASKFTTNDGNSAMSEAVEYSMSKDIRTVPVDKPNTFEDKDVSKPIAMIGGLIALLLKPESNFYYPEDYDKESFEADDPDEKFERMREIQGIDKRNKHMAKEIKEDISDKNYKNVYVVVGANHLSGLVEDLINQGFNAEDIKVPGMVIKPSVLKD